MGTPSAEGGACMRTLGWEAGPRGPVGGAIDRPKDGILDNLAFSHVNKGPSGSLKSVIMGKGGS